MSVTDSLRRKPHPGGKSSGANPAVRKSGCFVSKRMPTPGWRRCTTCARSIPLGPRPSAMSSTTMSGSNRSRSARALGASGAVRTSYPPDSRAVARRAAMIGSSSTTRSRRREGADAVTRGFWLLFRRKSAKLQNPAVFRGAPGGRRFSACAIRASASHGRPQRPHGCLQS